jgi:glucosamine kinase
VSTPVSALWAGIAGAGREAVRAELEASLARAGLADRVGVGTDVEAAFEDAFGTGPGILLLSGTGSIAYARAPRGNQGRVGGWGSLLGDEGSGYAIGVEAMKRIARSVDGRAPGTVLRERILGSLGLADPEELITWSSTASRAAIAGLVPEVQAAAAAGDAVAGEILVKAVDELDGHVLTILDTLGPWPEAPTVMLGGGLLQKGGPLRSSLERLMRSHGLQVLDRELDPARGAARRAAQLVS